MSKEEKYLSIIPQIQSLISEERDVIAKMSNVSSVLHSAFGFWWTGFYRVLDSQLVLGPFQGPVACTRIDKGRGVCGTAWESEKSIIVPDVEQFPGHIACSSESRSEIVVPCFNGGKIAAVLDIDSNKLNTFDETDKKYLQKIASLIYPSSDQIWFAAGCFWGAQKFFKQVEGVEFTEVGFANGWEADPTYKRVYTDETGYAECVHIIYKRDVVSLRRLVELFLKVVDPFSVNRQGEDEGTRYRTGIYFNNQSDCVTVNDVISAFETESGRKVAIEIQPLDCFYRAEEYHQDYLDKNPDGYCHLSPEIFKLARSGE